MSAPAPHRAAEAGGGLDRAGAPRLHPNSGTAISAHRFAREVEG